MNRRWHEKMKLRHVPKRLWDFGLKYVAKIMRILPKNELQGRTSYEEVTGKTQDKSEYCDFDFLISSGIMPEYIPA